VSYDPSLQGILTGQGTNQLGIQGAAVTVNATALGSIGIVVDYNISESTAMPFVLRLLPGSHLIEDAAGHTVAFTINLDGTISYATTLDNKLLGRGTKTLTVKSLS
jgi:hypothetical protein